MAIASWPSDGEVQRIKSIVAKMSGREVEEVRVVTSPYRICPLGAHIDHQGGTVSAMTINKGILLGFVPSTDASVHLLSGQFEGEVTFNVSDIQCFNVPRKDDQGSIGSAKDGQVWGHFPRGAAYALQSRGNSLSRGIIGYIDGSEGLDSVGLSSSAAVGISYLLALEFANNLSVSPMENIEYDRIIENEYLGLRNGILDQSAILLSSRGCLMLMDCKSKQHKLVHPLKSSIGQQKAFNILLAFSGLRKSLISSSGYNRRVEECQDAARALLKVDQNEPVEPLLCNVEPACYASYKSSLSSTLAKRAEHYFSENMRVAKGVEAWRYGNIEAFGELVSASGLSSIQNYECGCEPLIQLYNILIKAPGVYGARFSGAGFRGCCLAFVDSDRAEEASTYVMEEYRKVQPELADHVEHKAAVLICEAGDAARII